MLGRQDHERRPEQRVRARGVDPDRLPGHAIDREVDLGPHAPADPVRLHDPHLLRPLVELRQVVQQTVRVVGDLQKPLLEVALFDLDVGVAPAPPVDHLLVGEHRLVDRAPVDRSHRAIRQAALQHQQEQPLRPPVVIGLAGGDLAVPVVEDAHQLQLALALGDVVARPLRGMQSAPALHRRVLGRQAERVPAEGMQDLESLHPLHPRQHVAHDVVARMPDRQVTRWVRVHDEVVELRLRRAVGRRQDAAVGPGLLPLRLDLLGYVDATAGTADHELQILGMPLRGPRSRPGPGPRPPPGPRQSAGPRAGPRPPAPTPARWPG